jgi:pyruvate dehydrogenase E2 component (dihydrolipoamide acetyltransferase)
MDTLRLVEWLKKPGDPVEKGEMLFVAETDKSTLEIESPASGTVYRLDAEPGMDMKVLSSIGLILAPGEAPPVETPAAAVKPAAAGPAQALSVATAPVQTAPRGQLPPERANRVFASPRARHLAETSGFDLAELRGKGSGPGNVIISADVRAYMERRPVPARPAARVTPLARRMAEKAGMDPGQLIPGKTGAPVSKADIERAMQPGGEASAPGQENRKTSLSPVRATIARRMRESLDAAAPVTYMREVDATRLHKLRKNLLEALQEGEVKPTLTDLLVSLTCRALALHPQFNATFDGSTLEQFENVNMSLAVDTDKGLMVPVITGAAGKGIQELAGIRAALVDKARSGQLAPQEYSGGTFTISNLGALGVDFFTPILNPPQVAILGVGAVRRQPYVRKGNVSVRRVMGLSLTCDHRVIDGAPAARFLADLCRLVENPDITWL